MRRLIILGARTTGSSLDLVNQAFAADMDVTILTGPDDGLSETYEHIAQVVSLGLSEAEVIAHIISDIRPHGQEILLTTAHDRYAALAAAVCETLSLPGPDSRAVASCISKQNQDLVLRQMGLKLSRTVVADLTAVTPDSVFDGMRFPVVVKPVEGSASEGVRKCRSVAEVLLHMEALRRDCKSSEGLAAAEQVLIEGFVAGQEYCVETFDGRFVGLMKKNKTPTSGFVERGYSTDVDLCEVEVDRLARAVEAVVEKLGLAWGPVHIDCIVADGGLHIIEVNPRLAGSFIPAIIRDAWGFDMVDALLQKLSGKVVEIPMLRQPVKFAQVVFIVNSDPVGWNTLASGGYTDANMTVTYAAQELPSRSRRSYIYTIMG